MQEKIKNTVEWLKKIEELNYPWSLEGYNVCRLGASGIFCKLATIYQNHAEFDKEKLKNTIETFKSPKGYYVDIPGKLNIIAETRQAMSGLYNLGYEIESYDVSDFFQEPLFFMNDGSWTNPWNAGAQLSHYLFFSHFNNEPEKIQKVFNQLKRYQHRDGWYSHKPQNNVIINGIMKIFTGFDAIGYELDEGHLKGILDFVLNSHASSGGCNVYDYVYVLAKCMKINYRTEEATTELKKIYKEVFEYQHSDGGFSYDKNRTQTAYYGQPVTPGLPIGGIHGTGLFSMTLALIDQALKLDLGLELPLS